jgi:hypothetical protein
MHGSRRVARRSRSSVDRRATGTRLAG